MNYAFHSEAEAEFKHAIDCYENLGDLGRRSQEMSDDKISIWSSVHRRAGRDFAPAQY